MYDIRISEKSLASIKIYTNFIVILYNTWEYLRIFFSGFN